LGVLTEELRGYIAALERVPLRATLRAKLQMALSALAKVALLVNLSWRFASVERAPAEVRHLIDGLIY